MTAAFFITTMLLVPAAEQLGDAKFSLREAADRALAVAGHAAPLASRPHHDTETMMRLRRLRNSADFSSQKWFQDRIVALWGENKKMPWICLGIDPRDDSLKYGYYRKETRDWVDKAYKDGASGGWMADDYEPWRYATRMWAEEQLRQGKSSTEVRKALAWMAKAEAEYWKRAGL